jgi:hypothetical protein
MADPAGTADEVRALLTGSLGTPLEPFVIDRDDLRAAVILVRRALSVAEGRFRFRVASAEGLGPEGGIVVTRNLRTYVAERFARGARPTSPTCGFIAPAMRPIFPRGGAEDTSLAAQVEVAADGIRIEVPAPPLHEFGWASSGDGAARLADMLTRNSTIGSPPLRLRDLGLRCLFRGASLVVEARAAEAVLRLGAQMVDGSEIRLRAEPPLPLGHEIAMELSADLGPSASARVMLRPGFSEGWLGGPALAEVEVDNELRASILAWGPYEA